MKNIFRKTNLNVKRFLCNQEGGNLIEFAFMLPVLLILLFGMVDLSRYYQFHQKMDNATYTFNNLIAAEYIIHKDEIDTYAATIPYLLQPFDTSDLQIIVTAVERPDIDEDPEKDDPPHSIWQFEYLDTSRPSKIVTALENTRVDLPNFEANQNFRLEQGDQVLITEIYMTFHFTFASTSFYKAFNIPSGGIYKINITRPRYNTFKNKNDIVT